MGNKGTTKEYKAGYEYLLAYKITIPIYDLTIKFTNKWIDPYSRTKDQMVQAARSGSANIAEGFSQEGRKGYIKLAGVAKASLEELLKDYQAFARHNDLEIWDKERSKGKIREIGEIWEIIKSTPTLPNNPKFPNIPNEKPIATNLMITLVHQAIYLQEKLITSIKEKHKTEGGLTEELYHTRKKYRGY